MTKGNEVSGWFEAIDKSAAMRCKSDDEWRKSLGNPQRVIDLDDLQTGLWQLENGDVLTATIINGRAIRSSSRTYSKDFVAALAETSNLKE